MPEIMGLISSVLEFEPLAYTTLGVVVGVLFGVVPGITGTLALALLLPLSVFIDPLSTLGLLMGAYKGSHFGGSITAIAFGTPGTPDAVVATFDGYTMTRKGYPKKAMSTALYTSVVADTASDLILILVTAPLAALAIAFGPRELLGLTLMSLVIIVIFVQESPIKGGISAALGGFIGSIGSDPTVAISERFTFDLPQLLGGIQLVPFVIGLVGLSMLWERMGTMIRNRAEISLEAEPGTVPRKDDDRLAFREWMTGWKQLLSGIGLGTIIGAIPGPGSTVAAYSGYALAKRTASDRANFGKGSVQGLVAAEAANSATVGATFFPLFAFGIPGSVTAALFATGMIQKGLAPGPTTFVSNPEIMYAFFILLILANMINFVASKLFIPVVAIFTRISPSMLFPSLAVICLVGSYAYTNSYLGIAYAIAGAALGSLLNRWSIPNAPLIITVIVVPIMEQSLRRAMIISDGSLLYFVSSPLAVVLYLIIALAIGLMLRKRRPIRNDPSEMTGISDS